MFDLTTSSGRARALRSVQPEVSEMTHALLTQGGALARAVGRGGTPAWITAGGAVLAAGALYWLVRPSSPEPTPQRKPAAKTAAAAKRRPAARRAPAKK